MKLYRMLDKYGNLCTGGEAQWSLPEKQEDSTWKPGEWMPKINGKLIYHENGYHLLKEAGLISGLGETIYAVEYRGEAIEEGEDVIVVRECRLLKKYENWNERTARLFACWCVREMPLADDRKVWNLLTDERSRRAVEVAEKYANGEATAKELEAARVAANDVLWIWSFENMYAASRAAAHVAEKEAWAAASTAAYSAACAAEKVEYDAACATENDSERPVWKVAQDSMKAAFAVAKIVQLMELLRIIEEEV